MSLCEEVISFEQICCDLFSASETGALQFFVFFLHFGVKTIERIVE